MAGRLGSPYNTNPDSISFGTIASGSVVVTGSIGVDPSSDPNQVLKSAREISSSNTAIGSFQMVGSTYTANGFEESSSINMPLILGLSIPLTILFIVVVVVIVIKVIRDRNSVAEKDVAKMDVVVEPNPVEPDDTANNLQLNKKRDMKSTQHETFS